MKQKCSFENFVDPEDMIKVMQPMVTFCPVEKWKYVMIALLEFCAAWETQSIIIILELEEL